MFSGIISAIGEVRALRRGAGGGLIEVAAAVGGEALQPGESIAVQGVCLTVITPSASSFSADLSPETLARSTLGAARAGQHVNLERALRLGDRLGGHLVLGHVDATVRVVAVRPDRAFRVARFSLPAAVRAEVAQKGSVAVDGVSLTVSALGGDWFEVALIPTTLEATTLGGLRPGAPANLETDVLAKYVRRALGGTRPDLADLLGERGDAAD